MFSLAREWAASLWFLHACFRCTFDNTLNERSGKNKWAACPDLDVSSDAETSSVAVVSGDVAWGWGKNVFTWHFLYRYSYTSVSMVMVWSPWSNLSCWLQWTMIIYTHMCQVHTFMPVYTKTTLGWDLLVKLAKFSKFIRMECKFLKSKAGSQTRRRFVSTTRLIIIKGHNSVTLGILLQITVVKLEKLTCQVTCTKPSDKTCLRWVETCQLLEYTPVHVCTSVIQFWWLKTF